MLGKKHSEATRLKMKQAHAIRKSTSPNGGKTSLYYQVRHGDRGIAWRNEVFARDSFICQDCGIEGGRLEAHHIKEFAKIFNEFLSLYSQFSPMEDKVILLSLALEYPEFWDISNGKTLCIECHKKYKTAWNKGLVMKTMQGGQ